MALNTHFPRLSLRTFGPSVGPSATCRWNSTVSQDSSAFIRRAVYDKQRANTRVYQRKSPDRERLQEERRIQLESKPLERFMTRDWKAGDVYSPHDLSPTEMKKWRKRQSPPTDAFDALKKNPLDLYKNFSIMSEYMTTMGRIKHRNETGLRPVNQRRIAKAIRRAIGLGLMPSVHRHPEILAAETKAKIEAKSGSF